MRRSRLACIWISSGSTYGILSASSKAVMARLIWSHMCGLHLWLEGWDGCYQSCRARFLRLDVESISCQALRRGWSLTLWYSYIFPSSRVWFFFLRREADVVKVFAVLAVFCLHDSKFLIDDFRQCDCGADCVRTPVANAIVTPSLDNDTSCYLGQIKELLLSSLEVRIVGIVVKMQTHFATIAMSIFPV